MYCTKNLCHKSIYVRINFLHNYQTLKKYVYDSFTATNVKFYAQLFYIILNKLPSSILILGKNSENTFLEKKITHKHLISLILRFTKITAICISVIYEKNLKKINCCAKIVCCLKIEKGTRNVKISDIQS